MVAGRVAGSGYAESLDSVRRRVLSRIGASIMVVDGQNGEV